VFTSEGVRPIAKMNLSNFAFEIKMIQELLVYLIFAAAAIWLGYKLFFSKKQGGCDHCEK
jgi:hypothetical protein